MAFTRQKVIQLALGQGGQMFPTLAGRLAFDLFCRTTDPAKPGKGEQAAITRAAPLMEKAQTRRLQTSRGWVAAHVFAAKTGVVPKGRALVIHGWRSRTDFMVQMIDSLAREGWEVVGLDLPGHGKSAGRTLNVKLGVEAVTLVNESFGPFDLAIGHSFGGVVAVNAAIGGIRGFEPVSFKRLAVIASPNSMPDLFLGVGRFFGLGTRAQSAMENRVHAVAGYPLETYVMADQLVRFDGAVLVIHAPDDREVSFAGAEAMGEAGDHVKLIAMPGLGHRRIISDEKVFGLLTEFAGTSSAVAA